MDQVAASPTIAIHGSVTVCGGARCTSARCQRVLRAFEVELTRRALGRNVRLSPSPCRGFCTAGPIAIVQPLGVLYCRVQPDDVPEIVEETPGAIAQPETEVQQDLQIAAVSDELEWDDSLDEQITTLAQAAAFAHDDWYAQAGKLNAIGRGLDEIKKDIEDGTL